MPFGVYGTLDGHVAMVAFQPDWFRNLMEALGKPEIAADPRYATRGPRMKHAAEINATAGAIIVMRCEVEPQMVSTIVKFTPLTLDAARADLQKTRMVAPDVAEV